MDILANDLRRLISTGIRGSGLTLSAAICALGLAYAPASQAVVLFSDTFNAETTGFNSSLDNFTVSDGTIDVIGLGFFDLIPGNGNYLDLDGTSSNAGRITSSARSLLPGVNYVLSFDLAGSRRGDTNTVRAGLDFNADSFFDVFVDVTLPSGAPLQPFTIPFTTSAATSSASIVFDHQGGDNFGLLLDNVVLESVDANQVPEPATLGLIGLGAALLFGRRRYAARN